ncbi:MAG: sigma-54 dependent transcriptional regulator [Bacteroidales bacterium]|nr:sigma-54 dependent transcriptional regulator [Bacteroidales bacterium]
MNSEFDAIKRRYGIIGFDAALETAIDIAVQVSKTDLSVLITGESGVGKENFPKIIHSYSARKSGPYIAVNCGAIPEGTIDSELFGHKKGAFTGAVEGRKGYFESADGGTIFLDEVADLPLATQVRLLRVLESGEYIKVGDSEVQKTNVRVVAATNVNIEDRIAKGKFRGDLYYRLCQVPIHLPALRERKGDIFPLFMKFASDFSEKYRIPTITLTEEAIEELKKYSWPGNIRQLKNITERISLLEQERTITREMLLPYLVAPSGSNLPALVQTEADKSDRLQFQLLFQAVGQLREEVSALQNVVQQLLKDDPGMASKVIPENEGDDLDITITKSASDKKSVMPDFDDSIIVEEQDEEVTKEKLERALAKHNGNRKKAAKELDTSERNVYRKIKKFDL